MAVQPNKYRGFRVTRGDATGEQLAILLPDTYRVLHIASAADAATDWNVANPTHPTVYVHSETTPATDYLFLDHDGTTGRLSVVGGTLSLNGVTTMNLQIGGTTYATLTATTLAASTAITSSSATAGIGYATGAGGTVSQLTSKSTGVTLNTVTGTITMHNASLAADTTVAFTLTNSAIAATDAVLVLHESVGTIGAYSFGSTAASGSAAISVHNNTPGALGEAIVLRFVVVKSVNA